MVKNLLLIVLLCLGYIGILPAQDDDCYKATRNDGISSFNKKDYDQAIELFELAKVCPDKPANHDLDTWISKCRAEKSKEVQRKRQEEEDRKRAEEERKKTQEVERARQAEAERVRQAEAERQRKEAAQQKERENAAKGYIEIKRIEFANTDKSNNIITGYGSSLYASDMKYLSARMVCDALSSTSQTVELHVKVINPDGTLKTGDSSPAGYSRKHSVTIRANENNQVLNLGGWGSESGGSYITGIYTYEVWYKGKRLFSQKVNILKKPGEATYLTVNGDKELSVTASGNGDTRTFRVHTDADKWDLTALPDWCQISTRENASFTIRYSTNSGNSRTGSFYVIAGDKTVKITINQGAGSNALSKGLWRSKMRKTVEYVTNKYDNGAYKGFLYNYQRHGLGVYWWNNESYYWGNWFNGNRSQMAIYIPTENYTVSNCPDCAYYVGGWNGTDKSGTGTCYDSMGNLIYYGDFANDRPLTSYPSVGNREKYKFQCIEYSDGDVYVGETINGSRSGYGIYIWGNGNAWYGPWKDGNRNGYGILMYYNGTCQSGRWQGDTYYQN